MEIEDLTGEKLDGRFELRELVGEGGYGAVFRGVQLSVGRECAVKVLSPEIVSDESTVERFRVEAKTTSRLDHPHTVVLYDFGRDEQHTVLFLAMELLEGETLREQIRTDGPLAVGEAIRIADQVAGSLQEAHEAGTVHRDVKPGNLMLVDRGGDDRFVKVIDFGIAKAMRDDVDIRKSLTEQGMMIGTPAFMSPEQVRGDGVDGRTDQYALAMTFYFATTGAAPFQEGTPMQIAGRHLTDRPDPLSSYRPDLEIPPELDEVLLRALSTEPGDRFETIGEFGRHLIEAHPAARERPGRQTTEPVAKSEGADRTDSGRGIRREAESSGGASIADDEEGATLAVAASDWEAGSKPDRPARGRGRRSADPGPTEGADAVRTALYAVGGVAGLLVAGVLTGVATLWVVGGGPFAAAGSVARDTADARPHNRVEGGRDAVTDSREAGVPDDGGDASDLAGPAVGETPGVIRADSAGTETERRSGTSEPTHQVPQSGDVDPGSGESGRSSGGTPGKTGTLVVRMIPWGTLYVDGTRIGRGGRVETDLAVGRHELTMRQHDEVVARQLVRVRAGARRRLELAAP